MEHEKPSVFGAFFRGLGTGLLTGLVMSLIAASVIWAWPMITGGTAVAFLSTLLHTTQILAPCSALFTGVMAAKEAMFDAPASSPMKHQAAHHRDAVVPVLTPGVGTPMMDVAETTDTQKKQWAADHARGDAQGRIQEILNNRALSDKNRATALLAERQAAALSGAQQQL
jgi:hypothetical protein